MKVKRMPCHPGRTGWNEILPAYQHAAEPLEGNPTADWLIIGGGFAGLTAARRLQELHPSDNIMVLDAARIAEGPAGRNSGFMIDLPHDLSSDDYGSTLEKDLAHLRQNREAIDYAEALVREFGLPNECFSRSGKTNGAASAKAHKHNQDYAAHLTKLGEAFEHLDAMQMKALTGSEYYQSGLHTPGTAVIQPAMYVRGLANGLRAKGVRIHENSAVVELSRGCDWVARTAKGQVTAPKVILAVNGHANSFGHFEGRLLHIFLYGSMTRALSENEVKRLGGEAKWGVTPSDPIGSTVRRISGTGGDRIIMRNRVTCNPSMKVSNRRVDQMARTHDRAFKARFPMLSNVEMEYSWGGMLCLSRNSVPALGEVDDGLYSACCQNGLGATKGTLHGKLMAEMASGQSSELLDSVLAQDQPARLPPAPITFLGANAVMRWGEFRAGPEV